MVKAEEATAEPRVDGPSEPETELPVPDVVEVLSDLTISVSMAGVAKVEVSVGTMRLPAAEVSNMLPSKSVSRFGPVVVTILKLAADEVCVLRI